MEQKEKIYEIHIKNGQEHRAALTPEHVNSPTEFFFNAYQEAKYQLREIVLASARISKSEKKELSTKKKIEQLHEYPNNVIAFCADRGRGKTTAMLSFSSALEALSDPQKGDPLKFWGNLPGSDHPLDVKFEVMAPIDPASMENSESVLQQMISQLFENFCKEVKSNYCRCDPMAEGYDLDAISHQFQKCAQAIDSLYKNQEAHDILIEDELDQIAEIGQSAKLLLLLHKLINSYLDFMCGKDNKYCLVVQIDDADMDIGRSYQILEDVRKYLGLPRVIVLMATNIQQLETTVEQHFLHEYKHGLKYSRSMITVERCHDIAVLYLEKAIPHTRRIYLPDIGETIRQHLSQLRVNYLGEKEQNMIPENGTYQKQLLDLLHQKTGMVFTFEKDYLHNLLPAHMRELSQFLPFFTSMEDVPDGYKTAAEIFRYQKFPDELGIPQFLDRWEKNLGRLEFYLVNLWSAINLREGSRNLFREFVSQPEKMCNLYLLRNIADYYVRERVSSESAQSTLVWDESDFRNELTRACELRGIDLTSYSEDAVQGEVSASYADVMGVLAALTALPGANRQYKFAYAIRLFYSIRLHITLIQEMRAIGEGVSVIEFDTLTDLLGDTLLKYGPLNETARTPFGCWRLEMPVQLFQPQLIPYKSDNKEIPEIPFLRWKYQKDHIIHMVSTIAPGSVTGVWRSIGTQIGENEADIVTFSPLYPLLAALDRFIRFQNTGMIASDITTHMSQIYIALLVCLNWDVQRVLFKKVKNQTRNTIISMAAELYDRYIADLPVLAPKKQPSWLNQKCFTNVYEQAKETIFRVLIEWVHPVPEFKLYIRQANEGLNQFKQNLTILQKSIKNASNVKMSYLWEIAEGEWQNTLDSMDSAVQSAIFSSQTVYKLIQRSLRKGQHLYTLISNYQDNSYSLKQSSLTPIQIESALERYQCLLEQFLEHSWGTNPVKTQLQPETEDALSKEFPTVDSTPADDRKAAVKTLQELLRFGQQLLNVLNAPQQEDPSQPKG